MVFHHDPRRNDLSNHVCIHRVQQISGQEDLSGKAHCHRLFAPLWSSCLGITDNCQYTTVKEMLKSPSQKPGQCLKSYRVLYLLLFFFNLDPRIEF